VNRNRSEFYYSIVRLCVILGLAGILFAYWFDHYIPYELSTMVLIVMAISLYKKYGLISVPAIVYTIIFFPALSPLVANTIMGASYYTNFSHALQTDQYLIDKVLSLFLVGCMGFFIGCRSGRDANSPDSRIHILYGHYPVILFLALIVLICAYLTEPGETLLTGSYTELRSDPLRATWWHILGVQILQVSWVFLFLLGRHKKILFGITTGIVIGWLFLHSRRVELIGIVMCLMLWLRFKYSSRTVSAIGIITFVLMSILPVIRHASWLGEGIQPFGVDNVFHYADIKEDTRFKLPGGAPSTIFMTAVQLVNEKDSGDLEFWESKTILAWISRLIPTPLAISNHDARG